MYVFADEAGNFDFSTQRGASKYFILGTLTMADCIVGTQLLELRRELAWQGAGLESTFHAAEDKQIVRDAVFGVLAGADFRADFTLFENRFPACRMGCPQEPQNRAPLPTSAPHASQYR